MLMMGDGASRGEATAIGAFFTSRVRLVSSRGERDRFREECSETAPVVVVHV